MHFWSEKRTKKLPKRCPNPSKIDVKNALFFNIDFWRFEPRFWTVLGLQFGAKLNLCWHIFRSWAHLGRLLGTFFATCCVWEGFWVDLGWIWTPQTYVLEAQTPYFSMVFVDNALIAAGNLFEPHPNVSRIQIFQSPSLLASNRPRRDARSVNNAPGPACRPTGVQNLRSRPVPSRFSSAVRGSLIPPRHP